MFTFVFKKNPYLVLFKDQFYIDTVSYKDIVTVGVLKTCTQDLNAETIILVICLRHFDRIDIFVGLFWLNTVRSFHNLTDAVTFITC